LNLDWVVRSIDSSDSLNRRRWLSERLVLFENRRVTYVPFLIEGIHPFSKDSLVSNDQYIDSKS